jgi:hypothetical protein
MEAQSGCCTSRCDGASLGRIGKKITGPLYGPVILYKPNVLADADFGAANALAGEVAELAGRKCYDTVAGCVDGVVGAELGAFTGALCQADLTNDDLTGFYSLAAEQLNT